MNFQILNNARKKKVMKLLNEQYGIEKLKHLFIESGRGKYRIYSGSLSKQEIIEFSKKLNLEIIGARICKIDKNQIRLNFDIMNLPEIKKQIKKNVAEISDDKINKWLKGDNLDVDDEIKGKGSYLIIKNKNDFLGMGQNAKTFIKNYMPKSKRIRN